MALNLKNEETTRLVRELSEVTGESLTTAVRTAVRERLERLRGTQRASAEALLAIGRDVAPRLAEPYRSADHADLLYDDAGLPR